MITIKQEFQVSEYEFLEKLIIKYISQELELNESTTDKLIVCSIYQKHFAGKKKPTSKKTIKFKFYEYHSLWQLLFFAKDLLNFTNAHQKLLEATRDHNAELMRAGIFIPKQHNHSLADYQQQFDDVFHDLEETYNKLSLEKIEGYELRKEN